MLLLENVESNPSFEVHKIAIPCFTDKPSVVENIDLDSVKTRKTFDAVGVNPVVFILFEPVDFRNPSREIAILCLCKAMMVSKRKSRHHFVGLVCLASANLHKLN